MGGRNPPEWVAGINGISGRDQAEYASKERSIWETKKMALLLLI